jgi:hypothetical protein
MSRIENTSVKGREAVRDRLERDPGNLWEERVDPRMGQV